MIGMIGVIHHKEEKHDRDEMDDGYMEGMLALQWERG